MPLFIHLVSFYLSLSGGYAIAVRLKSGIARLVPFLSLSFWAENVPGNRVEHFSIVPAN